MAIADTAVHLPLLLNYGKVDQLEPLPCAVSAPFGAKSSSLIVRIVGVNYLQWSSIQFPAPCYSLDYNRQESNMFGGHLETGDSTRLLESNRT